MSESTLQDSIRNIIAYHCDERKYDFRLGRACVQPLIDDIVKAITAWNRRTQPENKPLVRCGECAKYQSPNCAAKHEQALMDFCSHGERKPERSEG